MKDLKWRIWGEGGLIRDERWWDFARKGKKYFAFHSLQAVVSFQNTTMPQTKLRGVINLRDAWVRELKQTNQVVAVKVNTELNVADLLTKCHEHYVMRRLLSLFNCETEEQYYVQYAKMMTQ